MSLAAPFWNVDKYDVIDQNRPALGMLNSSLYPSNSTSIIPTQSAINYQKIKRKTLWELIVERFSISRFIKPSNAKIVPQKEREREIELTQYVRLENPDVSRIQIQPTHSANRPTPSLESIKRFKKTYEFLISENIIKVLVEDRFP
jgi:hypothetical protein